MYFPRLAKRHVVTALTVALWIPAVAYGINVLWKYSTTPGHPASPPLTWPSEAPVNRSENHATLLMFAHPECPCTRASLGELAKILAQAGGQLDAQVLVFQPPNHISDAASADLLQEARAIPGVQAVEDPNAAMAKTFGVFTSGQTLLYNSAGALLFKGGITAYRGHSGDNAGRSAIIALLRGEVSASAALPVVTPVFGCSLRADI